MVHHVSGGTTEEEVNTFEWLLFACLLSPELPGLQLLVNKAADTEVSLCSDHAEPSSFQNTSCRT